VIGPKSPALKRENTSDREFDTQVCDADAYIVAGFSRDNEHAARPLDNPEGARSCSSSVPRDFLVSVRRSVRLRSSWVGHHFSTYPTSTTQIIGPSLCRTRNFLPTKTGRLRIHSAGTSFSWRRWLRFA